MWLNLSPQTLSTAAARRLLPTDFASANRRTIMKANTQLSMRSATVAGIASSALLGLVGLTLNPTPAKAVVYCQYVE
jgi:hypothetical protein